MKLFIGSVQRTATHILIHLTFNPDTFPANSGEGRLSSKGYIHTPDSPGVSLYFPSDTLASWVHVAKPGDVYALQPLG